MKKKILAICLVLVIALAGIGVGFAMWSETLNLQGTVETGNVDVDWSIGGTWDSEEPEKNESSIECYYGANGQLDIILYDAYPCIDYYALVDVHNTGSVPVILTGLQFNAPSGVHVCMMSAAFGGYDGYPDIAEGTQLEPGDLLDPTAMAIGVVHVHLDNTLPNEVQTIYFTGSVTAVQYNEYD